MSSTDTRGGPGTATARAGGRRTTRPWAAAGAGALALGLTAAGLVATPALAIDTNPPTGPGNIEIFPKRDMVAIEGYAEYAGKKATIQVLRGGTVVGSAVGTVDSTGFLEVNHPGGVCWGAGTGLAVTPDIVGNDEIRVDFANTGGRWDGATTSDVEITDIVRDDATHSLTLSGRYGVGIVPPGADPVLEPGRIQVEIVNPEMRDATSAVGARAIGWPADEVPTGYTVTGSTTGSSATGGTFSTTFGFRDSRDLDLAEAGEAVVLGWQADAPVELGIEARYGVTLFEYHEASGPGFGGCPAGPEGLRASSPSGYTGKGAGPGSITVDWDAVTTVPGAPAVTGYSVRAVTDAGDEVGKRVDPATTAATLTGLEPAGTYSVEITSRSAAGESGTPAVMRLEASDHVVPAATATTLRRPDADGRYQPLVTNAAGVDFGVHLDPVAGVNGAEVHYTVDGSTPTLASPTFRPGLDLGIQVRQDTTVRWVVTDSGNVVGQVGSQFFDIVDAAGVTPPAVTRLAPLDAAVDVTFQTVKDANAYRVQAYDAGGTVRIGALVNAPVPTDPAATEVTRRMAGLVNGTGYTFTAAARVGTVWTSESAVSTVVAPVPAPKADAGAVQTVLRGRTATLDGSASIGAVGYQWVQLRPAGTAIAPQDPLVTFTGATTAKPTFRVPTLTGPTTDHTLQFRLTTTLADGTKKTATTSVNAQADAVTATEARWRAGNPLRMSGTGSQENAKLTFRDATATGPLIGTATVVGGQWTAPAATVNLSTGSIHVWSDFGYVGTILTTR